MTWAVVAPIIASAVVGVPLAIVTLLKLWRVERPDAQSKHNAALWVEIRDLREDLSRCQAALTECAIGRRRAELRVLDLEDQVAELREHRPPTWGGG